MTSPTRAIRTRDESAVPGPNPPDVTAEVVVETAAGSVEHAGSITART
jgi:hypothetical protein